MKTNSYLYGEEKPLEIPGEVIQDRLDKLETMLSKLLEVNLLQRDDARINTILKAINFWATINEK